MGTFGVTDVLASADYYFSDAGSAMKVAVTEACTVTVFKGYLRNTYAEACGVKVALYTHDAVNDRPDDLVGSAYSNVPASQAAGWYTFTPVSGIAVPSAGTYWLAINQAHDGVQWNYSDSGGDFSIDDGVAYSTWPPAQWAAEDYGFSWRLSLYAEYTTGGGGISLPLLNHLLLGD